MNTHVSLPLRAESLDDWLFVLGELSAGPQPFLDVCESLPDPNF
jgi:hypothetical protein